MRVIAVLALLALSPAASAAVSPGEGALLTSLVANGAARDARFDVLTRDDVKNAIAAEADRQSLGCAESSCLAELAGAMGARIVVYGSVGRLGDEMLMTLNLFDSDAARSGGRRVARGKTIGELSAVVEATTMELLEGFLQQNTIAAGTRVRLLVLDLELRDVVADAPPTTTTTAEVPLLGLAGVGVAVLGAVGLGVGAFSDVAAVGVDAEIRKPGVTQRQADALFTQRDAHGTTALIAYGIGAAAVAVGAGVAIAGFVLE